MFLQPAAKLLNSVDTIGVEPIMVNIAEGHKVLYVVGATVDVMSNVVGLKKGSGIG